MINRGPSYNMTSAQKYQQYVKDLDEKVQKGPPPDPYEYFKKKRDEVIKEKTEEELREMNLALTRLNLTKAVDEHIAMQQGINTTRRYRPY